MNPGTVIRTELVFSDMPLNSGLRRIIRVIVPMPGSRSQPRINIRATNNGAVHGTQSIYSRDVPIFRAAIKHVRDPNFQDGKIEVGEVLNQRPNLAAPEVLKISAVANIRHKPALHIEAPEGSLVIFGTELSQFEGALDALEKANARHEAA